MYTSKSIYELRDEFLTKLKNFESSSNSKSLDAAVNIAISNFHGSGADAKAVYDFIDSITAHLTEEKHNVVKDAIEAYANVLGKH